MSATRAHIKIAQSLPPQLQRFFQRFPPRFAEPASDPSSAPSPPTQAVASTPPTPVPNISFHSDLHPSLPDNPFKVTKHPYTKKWQDPIYSLRRQADLLKLARKHGVEDLMPHSVKSTAEKLKHRIENGLRVKGTGVGQKVKGKESERTMKGRLEKRRQAMLNMPRLIQTWKEKGHGRGWKKWPK